MSIAQLEQRKLILFDLDGTLVDSAHDLYRARYESECLAATPGD